ncbi:hypothetical protein BC8716_11190 [Shouchella clausii]|nr:hypothetical protein BC8716_11190 [Shouchella clausii]QNM42836.1 TetR/AcrR family transcriptional regulator [Shouchella clausii]
MAMTKEKIKQAALVAFAKGGYEGMSLAEVASAVGIKTPSIYAFFKSKQDLFMTIYHELLDEHAAQLVQQTNVMEIEGSEQRLRKVVEAMIDYHLREQTKTEFLTRVNLFPPDFLKDEMRSRFAHNEQQIRSSLVAIFSEGIEQGDIRSEPLYELVDSFLCLLDGLFLQTFYYNKEKLETSFFHAWKFYWQGISNRTANC